MKKFKIDPSTHVAHWDYHKHTILFISDMHIPYHHPDSIRFLQALKKKYNPDLVVSLGDMADFHCISFHDINPDLDHAGNELERLQEHAREIEKIFPNMVIIGSNHGDLHLRKALAHGLPKALFRPYNDIYTVGPGWVFVDDLTIKAAGQPDLYISHGIKKNALQVAQQRGQRFVCGHYHEDFEIKYCGNPNDLLWSMMAGCLIDKQSLAFEYNKLNLKRPVIGTGVCVEGYPRLIPMVLSASGRWVGRLL